MNQLEINHFPSLDYACNEAMNTLCTNLSYCGTDIRAILITSRYEHEGKSGIAMNVMRTLASYGKNVLLVDADLRCSTLARRYRFHFAGGRPTALPSIWRICAIWRMRCTRPICREHIFCLPDGRRSTLCSCWLRLASAI